MKRAQMKALAEERLNGNVAKYFLAYLLPTLIVAGLGVLSFFVLDFARIEAHRTGNVAYAIGGLVILAIISFLIAALPAVFNMGVLRLGMKLYAGEKGSVGDTFSGFKIFGKTLWLNIITGFFTMLWSLLLVVPGIIKAYSYAMAPYVLAENPHFTARQALRESKKIMKGKKWKFFVLVLSFFFWNLLVLVTLSLSGFYVFPYMSLTFITFYKECKVSAGGVYAGKPARFCLNCGKLLVGDEECSCGVSVSGSTEPAEAKPLEPAASAPEPDIVVVVEPEASAPVVEMSPEEAQLFARPTKFCIYCGNVLHGDEICSCRGIDVIRDTIDIKKEIGLVVDDIAASEAKATTIRSRFCIRCGRELFGDEVCNCASPISDNPMATIYEVARVAPEGYTPPEPRDIPEKYITSVGAEKVNVTTTRHYDETKPFASVGPVRIEGPMGPVSGLKSTMRKPKTVDPREEMEKEAGKKFLSRAGDLD